MFYDANLELRAFEWDGAQWTQRPGTASGILAFDTARGAVLDFNGNRLLLETATPAAAIPYGTPCGGTATATSLTAFGVPRPGAQYVAVESCCIEPVGHTLEEELGRAVRRRWDLAGRPDTEDGVLAAARVAIDDMAHRLSPTRLDEMRESVRAWR